MMTTWKEDALTPFGFNFGQEEGVGAYSFHIIIIFDWDTHHLMAKDSIQFPLYWLGVHIRPN